MTKSLFCIGILLMFQYWLMAQIPTGSWREHLPYSKTMFVANSPTKVYCATPYSLFSYDKSEKYIEKKSKIDGLSDLGIGHIAYSNKHNLLLVGYQNGNIDVITSTKRYNFPDIKNKNIMFDKGINQIALYNDTAFISTGFGIVVFNLARMEIADTYILGPMGTYKSINACVVFQNKLYALTPDGIMCANLNHSFLSNYQNWETLTNLPYGSQNYFTGCAFGKYLMVGHNYSNSKLTPVSLFDGHQWDTYGADTIAYVTTLKSQGTTLLISYYNLYVKTFDQDFKPLLTYQNYNNNDADFGENGTVWIATNDRGLVAIGPGYGVNANPAGPAGLNAFAMLTVGNTILTVPGAYNRSSVGSFTQADAYHFTDEKWGRLTTNPDVSIFGNYDAVCLASQNNPDHYFIGTWGYGIIEVKQGQVQAVYNQQNTNEMFDKYPFVSGMATDSKGNLWTVHRNTNQPFKVKTPDGNWYSYDFGGSFSGKTTGKVMRAKNGDYWCISFRGDGIMVWNDNQTPENGADDKYLHFYALAENGTSLDRYYNSIAQDVNGAIWIGTDDGPIVYDYPQNILAGKTFYARRPQVVEDGYLNPLLEEKRITAIAIDGANRKWLATEGAGLYLVSADGTAELISFSQNSSPLFSDNIQALTFSRQNSELFIATDKGIQSYMTSSSAPRSSFTDVYAFPNPVRPDYAGVITIRGLMYNTNVKIIDTGGRLVFETTSEGGDAIWNGQNMEGKKVASGIYTVLLNNPDGSQSDITKIMIIR
jgi:hypothetical protein